MPNGNSKFTNFKVHTQYSICEGAIKIPDLANYCKENKIPSIGISDNYNLCGALEFSQEISKVGTQPIIGSQINFKYQDVIAKLPLFAKTEIGFQNLTKLSSKSYLDVKENSEQFDNQSGFNISKSRSPDVINAPSSQNIQCSISTNNANIRSRAISNDLAEAKANYGPNSLEYKAALKKR